jgi:hypothetical protein
MTDIGSALRWGVARLITPEDFSGVKRACASGASTPASSASPKTSTLDRLKAPAKSAGCSDLRKAASG